MRQHPTERERFDTMKKALVSIVVLVVVGVLAIGGALWWIDHQDRESGEAPPPSTPAPKDEVARGGALVALADCQSCHTARGGQVFAGGRAIPTPFGTFYSPNITPEPQTGIGSWSADDFWHALHN